MKNIFSARQIKFAHLSSFLTAKENVWGLCFESCNITAGGDICANYLLGCEVSVEGRASILGGKSQISNSTVYAKNGVVAQVIGARSQEKTIISAGLDATLIDRFDAVDKRVTKLTIDIQSTQQNISTFERINRTKPDKGRKDPAYLEMTTKKNQMMSVYTILTNERTRLKRLIDQFSVVSIVAKEAVYPGVMIHIDTRSYEVTYPLQRTKFRRNGDTIELVGNTPFTPPSNKPKYGLGSK